MRVVARPVRLAGRCHALPRHFGLVRALPRHCGLVSCRQSLRHWSRRAQSNTGGRGAISDCAALYEELRSLCVPRSVIIDIGGRSPVRIYRRPDNLAVSPHLSFLELFAFPFGDSDWVFHVVGPWSWPYHPAGDWWGSKLQSMLLSRDVCDWMLDTLCVSTPLLTAILEALKPALRTVPASVAPSVCMMDLYKGKWPCGVFQNFAVGYFSGYEGGLVEHLIQVGVAAEHKSWLLDRHAMGASVVAKAVEALELGRAAEGRSPWFRSPRAAHWKLAKEPGSWALFIEGTNRRVGPATKVLDLMVDEGTSQDDGSQAAGAKVQDNNSADGTSEDAAWAAASPPSRSLIGGSPGSEGAGSNRRRGEGYYGFSPSDARESGSESLSPVIHAGGRRRGPPDVDALSSPVSAGEPSAENGGTAIREIAVGKEVDRHPGDRLLVIRLTAIREVVVGKEEEEVYSSFLSFRFAATGNREYGVPRANP